MIINSDVIFYTVSMKANPTARNRTFLKSLATVLVVIACIAVLWGLATGSLPVLVKWVLAIFLLFAVGEIIIKLTGATRALAGIYLLGWTAGIGFIDRISKNYSWFWKGLANWGIVVCLGVFSFFLFRKNISKRMLVLGVISILFFYLIVLPDLSLTTTFVNFYSLTPKIQSAANTAAASSPSPLAYLLLAINILFGFVGWIFSYLVLVSATTLYAIFTALINVASSKPNPYQSLSSTLPGVYPIIPGITLPLVAGLAAFVLAMAVHEFSHGVLARIMKSRINRIGILFLGIIPIGAFVEPDDKQVEALAVEKKSMIFAAGVSMNLLVSLIFLVALFLFTTFVLPSLYSPHLVIAYTVPGSPAYGVIPNNSTIISWNGQQITSSQQIQTLEQGHPYANVTLVTNKGTFLLQSDSQGKLGIAITQQLSKGFVTSALYTFYTFIVLSLILNFLLAVLNFLPLPLLDGWQLYKANLKKSDWRILRLLGWIVFACFIIEALPILWNFPI